MKVNTQFQKLKPLLKKSLFRASDARELGISPSLINYYIKKGVIERIDRGVYRSAGQELDVDFRYEDLVLISKSIPEGVICLISALTIYELTDEIAREHWIAVSNHTRAQSEAEQGSLE
jgi:predicted transcriptional regulator of viral defense system